MAAAADIPRWKDNQLKIFKPESDILPTREEWHVWTLSSAPKFNAMDYEFFIPAAEALILEDEEFHSIVNHPVRDTLTGIPFKKKVITMLVGHWLLFPIAADNTNPDSDAKYVRNYAYIVRILKGIHSQLSDACSGTFSTIFTIEQQAKHPLQPLRVWKRMTSLIYSVSAKDRGQCMTYLQQHARTVLKWDLDDIKDWVTEMEVLRQDLLTSGHNEAAADDCIVNNLLFINIPAEAPFAKDWEHDACD